METKQVKNYASIDDAVLTNEVVAALVGFQEDNNLGLNRIIEELREVSDVLLDSIVYGIDKDEAIDAVIKIRAVAACISKLSKPEQEK